MLTTFFYKKGKAPETELSRARMLAALGEKDGLLWVDLEDPSEFESECLVEIFNFHPLAIEDCLSDVSEPKVDDYEDYLFLVTHAVAMEPDEQGKDELVTRELHIFFAKNYAVTFHKKPVKAVAQVRDQARRKAEQHLSCGTDMLVHAILDRLVDNYQPMLDLYDEKIDRLEDEIFNNPPSDYLATLMQVKRDIYRLRRVIMPQRETINYLTRTPAPFIRTKNLIYFRDIHDHLIRLYGMTDGYHEHLASILQAYFSYSSHKLNEIVKHMTALATLTMPMLIVASIYGMNFEHMPELGWKFGYPFSILAAVAVSLTMLAWMKSRKWL